MKKIVCILIIPIILLSCTKAEIEQEIETQLINEKIDHSSKDVRAYKLVEDRKLELHIFYPDNYDPNRNEPYPTALSIHGGGWTKGNVTWGYSEASFMASLGLIGIAVEYRLADYNNVSALDCIQDINTAVRWARIHADELNIDINRVVTIGGSAGGHLSISSAMFPYLKEENEDSDISSVPNLAFALAPAVELTKDSYYKTLLLNEAEASDCSPNSNIKKIDTPIYIFHGDVDEVVPVEYTRDFVESMKGKGNEIELWEFPGGKHNFFYEVTEGINFWHEKVEIILRDYGYIE